MNFVKVMLEAIACSSIVIFIEVKAVCYIMDKRANKNHSHTR